YFGRAHGIPVDPAAAATALLDAGFRPVQVGLVNDRLFLVNASVGLYPQLFEDREAYKKKFGRSKLVALWAGITTLTVWRHELVLELVHEGRARILRTPTLVVGNNRLQLEQIGMPEAEIVEHGYLSAIAVRSAGLAAMLGLLARGAVGRLGAAENVVSFSFR